MRVKALLVILASVMIGAHCGSSPPTSPSSSGFQSQTEVLTIVPSMDALKINETQRLAAALVNGNGSQKSVDVTWSSDSPDVVSVGQDGQVRGVQLGTSVIHANYQALSASRAMRVVPDYGGTWNGSYQITKCTRASGSGSDVCRHLGPLTPDEPGAVFPISVQIDQNGDTITGTVSLYSNTHALNERGNITGAVDNAGVLRLTASTHAVDPTESSQSQFADWVGNESGDGLSMSGTFSLTQTFRNIFGVQVLVEQCQLVSLARAH